MLLSGGTTRQRAAAGAVLFLMLATGAAAVLGWSRVAVVGLSMLTGLGSLMILDVRARQHRLARHVRSLDRRQAAAESAASSAPANDRLRQRIGELETKLAAEQAENARLDDLERASYRQSLRQHVRVFRAEHRLGLTTRSAALQLPYKLRTMELAASHGISTPEVYRVWPDVDSIDLSGLPDTFVLKADGGAGSVAVFPLQRSSDGRYDVVGGKGTYSEQEMRDRIRALGRRARAPYFAEEMLLDADGGPIPNDVKCYMFYGQVGHILVRHVARHGDASTIRLKFVDEHGADYGEVAVGRKHDPSIPVPASLPRMVNVAEHLSRAVGLPFCRVDLYDTSRGIVLGEITRAPSGGNERFVRAHDELLGERWVDGSARLAADLSAGRPAGPIFGNVSEVHLYPATDGGRSPALFGHTVVDCAEWCR